MRNFIIAFFLLLFVSGLAVNNYLRFNDEIPSNISFVEEEEESKSKLYELQEFLALEDFFQDYIISQILIEDINVPHLVKTYEDVYLSCIETPPDFLI